MARPTTGSNGQIQKREDDGGERANLDLLKKMDKEIARALPRHISGERFARVVLTAARQTPKLLTCTKVSLLGCVLSAAQLGLEPNTPLQHCYLIPRWNKKAEAAECTLMIGYQGMIDLARRSGQVTNIYARVVRDGDHFEYHYGLEPMLEHRPGEGNEGAPLTHVYAVATTKDGPPIFEVLTKREVEARRKRGVGGPAWRTDYNAMAKKSAVRALWPWLPKSSEMANAQILDESAAGVRPVQFDADVTAALQGQDIDTSGVEVVDVELEDEPEAVPSVAFDPTTGEVRPEDEPTDDELNQGGK